MADFGAPSCRPSRKGQRRSASATVNIPESFGLELRQHDAAQARSADIVDQWLAKRTTVTQCYSGPVDSVTDVPVPLGEVANNFCLTTSTPAALQPTETIEPVMVELPMTSDEEEMDESTTQKRG